MMTECKFVPATALDGLAANLATLLEWSRLQDNDGIGFFFITNGAVYMDNIAPTVCCTVPDAVRCARHELKQLKLRDFSDLLEFVADDSQSPTADDLGMLSPSSPPPSAPTTPYPGGTAATPGVTCRRRSSPSNTLTGFLRASYPLLMSASNGGPTPNVRASSRSLSCASRTTFPSLSNTLRRAVSRSPACAGSSTRTAAGLALSSSPPASDASTSSGPS